MEGSSIVRPEFCAPYPIDLVIVKKMLSNGKFGVSDMNGNIIFKVKSKLFSLRDRRILVDAANNHILSFQRKIMTVHDRWRVFRGDSSNERDLLFSVKKSSMFQFKTKLDVFLASNTSENVCDFKVRGSTIKAGGSTDIVAKMHKKHTIQSVILGKDTYGVTVYPNVDYAFIVALVVILEEINHKQDSNEPSSS